MECSRCAVSVADDDMYDYYGQKVCENCYMYLLNPPKSCDPTAVTAAVTSRKQAGQTGTEGLTALQQKICEIVSEKGKITRRDLCQQLDLPDTEIEAQLAVLRHCELIRGFKDKDLVYLTTW